jgi:long-chain acyl-CoA synthetase
MASTAEAPVTAEQRKVAATTGMTVALHAARAPDRPAILSAHGERTFAEVNANANRLVRALRERGLRAGDSMALICANRPEFAEAVLAATRMGVRLTPVNWHLTGEEIAYILDNSESRAVIADARFASAVSDACSHAAGVEIRLAVAGEIAGHESYEQALAAQSGEDIGDPCLGRTMLYTSGTTGRPKGVDRNIGAAGGNGRSAPVSPLLVAINQAGPYEAGRDVHLCTGPLYHAAPLAFSLTMPLNLGVTVVLMDAWDPEETLRLIERHRVTHTHMVPTMFHRMLALPQEVRERYDVSSLGLVLHGAAPCPVPVKHALIEWFGPVVCEYYAATEGTATFITAPEWLTKPGSVGRPSDEDLVIVLDDEGERLGPHEVGTVYLRAPEGPARFRYYKDDEKTESTYLGDHFTLGDHGYLDEDGYLFLTGRSSELIISGGVNIYPAEVDDVLLTHPAVADVGTIGLPDEEWGEQVVSVVEVHDGHEPTEELAQELRAHCRQRLAGYKCPRRIEFNRQLPRSYTGKLYRRRLRESYLGAAAGST